MEDFETNLAVENDETYDGTDETNNGGNALGSALLLGAGALVGAGIKTAWDRREALREKVRTRRAAKAKARAEAMAKKAAEAAAKASELEATEE